MVEQNQETPKADTELAEQIEQQLKLIAELEDTYKKASSDELEIEIKREHDTLRHLKSVQKGNPKNRAETKSKFAAKAALSRAIQSIEE